MKRSSRSGVWPAFRRISMRQLILACQRVVELAEQYKPTEHHREMGYDGLLFGFLDARFGKVSRQYPFRMGKSSHPKRLDFRQGGSAPVVIEFAVRTPGRNEIYGSQNTDEIRKLARQRKASARYLLLLDMSNRKPLGAQELEGTYRDISAGPGNFDPESVRVIYVHPQGVEQFLWHSKREVV